MITERQILQDLNDKKYAPVYLLTGEENYYIDLLSDYFEEHIVAEECADFDRTVVYGRDVDMSTVVGYARRYPMMSPVQLVLVKEAQDIPMAEWDTLAAYLEKPQPTTVLVFCYRHKKLDKRTKVYKAINAKGVFYEKAKLREEKIPEWVANLVAKRGFSITEKGALLITESLGNDLGKINNELSKVFISLPKGGVIDEEIIERNIGISKDYNIFELQSAIGSRDIARCTRIVNHLAANPKEIPIQMLLPSLYGYFIKIMLYHQLTDPTKAAATLGVPPFFLGEYKRAAANYSLGKLASCIGYLHDADLRSKGVRNNGNTTDGELIKELVFKIIH